MFTFSASTPLLPQAKPPFLSSFSHTISQSLPIIAHTPMSSTPSSSSTLPQPLKIQCIDTLKSPNKDVQLQRATQHTKPTCLKIAIIGFGNFGQFLARAFINQGHTVLAHSRSNYTDTATKLGVSFFSDLYDLCEQHPQVVILSSSILSTESVLESIPYQSLKRSTLFVDVLSVKEFPKELLLKYLPADFDILCTHPMFGPQSGKHSWAGLPLMYDKVRLGDDNERNERCEKFLNIFAQEGCRMVEMTCEEHDKHAAGSQFVTHTMGRLLEKYGLEPSPINTKGYETLLNLVENTAKDSFELYYGLFMYNKNAMKQLERLDMAFEMLKREIFGHLHEVSWKHLYGKSHSVQFSKERQQEQQQHELIQKPPMPKLLPNGNHLKPQQLAETASGS